MQRFIENITEQSYDILVIGGGISGAAVAYEAASRGFSVALVEKGDFGAATSAATSKLIHGGLRYLANRELRLVRESLRERKTLENIAPNFIYPLAFLVPLYEGVAGRGKRLMELGMLLYDLLSYDKRRTWDRSKQLPHFQSLTPEQALALEPAMLAERLNGAIRFYDCANLNPERLTLAFIKSAVRCGAQVANYTRVEAFTRQDGCVRGVVVRDLLHERTATLCARLTINCGGPWADLLLEKARGEHCPQQVRRSEGIHLITRSLTNAHCVSNLTASGRPINIIPWRGHSLIGSTDREYQGDPDEYRVTKEKIVEFIGEINSGLQPASRIGYSDVRYAYGGLRPLVDDDSPDVVAASRRYEIYDNAADGLEGMLTVEGGKYTTSRNLAENVLKLAARKLGSGQVESTTSRAYLAGCEIPDIEAFLAGVKTANPHFDPAAIETLARLYGSDLDALLEISRREPALAAPLSADGEMLAQVVYAIRSEMARTLGDILLRRTGLGTLGDPGSEVLDKVARTAAAELGWSDSSTARELSAVQAALAVPG